VDPIRTAPPHGFVSEGERTYLITGATGFLGRHILQSLRKIAPDSRAVILVRDPSSWENQSWRSEAGNVDVVCGSLLDAAEWKSDARLAKVDGIFHLAAIVKHTRSSPEEMMRINVGGTLNMVRLAAEKRSRLVFASSSGTVGCSPESRKAPNEDAPYADDAAGKWPYYSSKIRAEKEARALAEKLGVELIIFRPPVMLGPKDHRFRSTSNLLRLLRKKLPFILDGQMHFVDVRDVAEAMVRAMLHPAPQPVYHLRGHVSTLDDFFRQAAREAGVTPSWRILPTRFLRYAAGLNDATRLRLHAIPDPVVIEMATHHWDISSRYAERDLAYRPRPPEETLRDTIKWMRENHPALKGTN
jgi:nucleoside-diphosphate-sugar epimerase